MTFAAATVALYNAFAIGPGRIVAYIIRCLSFFSMIWTDLLGVSVGAEQMLAV